MGSRDRPHKEVKKKAQAKDTKPSLSPLLEPPTNVEFGGSDRSVLYVTAGKSLYRIHTDMKGFHLWPPR